MKYILISKGDRKTKLRELLEKYRAEKTRVQLKETGLLGRVWIGTVTAVKDERVEFNGIHPCEIIENMPCRIRRLTEKDIKNWAQKVWSKARSFTIPLPNIRSVGLV